MESAATTVNTSASYIKVLEEEIAAATMVPFALVATNLRAVLDEWGFAVIPDVLSESDLVAAQQLWKDDLISIINPSSSKAVTKKLLQDPIKNWDQDSTPLGKKFVTLYGLPHGKMAWSIRSHPHVKEIYEHLYHTPELCVGMDTIFFQNCPPCVNEKSATTNLWPHADQNKHVRGSGQHDEFQSVTYIWDCDATTAATVVWPKSHKAPYERLMEQTTQHSKHFCMVRDDAMMKEFATYARRIPVPAGGMIMWSSRTIHQGWPNGPRLAVPVCYEPSSRRTGEVLEKKKQLVRLGLPSSHWASICVEHSLSQAGMKASEGLVLTHTAHSHVLGGPDGQTIVKDIEKLL